MEFLLNPKKKNYSKLLFTVVYYSLLYFKTMVPWKFDLQWKNYETMNKVMVLWTKLCYYGKNYGTILRAMKLRFTNIKNIEDYKKVRNYGDIPKQL